MSLFRRLEAGPNPLPDYAAATKQPDGTAYEKPSASWNHLYMILGALENHRGVLDRNTPGLPPDTCDTNPEGNL